MEARREDGEYSTVLGITDQSGTVDLKSLREENSSPSWIPFFLTSQLGGDTLFMYAVP